MEGEQTDENVAFRHGLLPRGMRRALLPEGGEILGVGEVKQGEAGSLLNANLTGHKSGPGCLDLVPQGQGDGPGSAKEQWNQEWET